jgi:hypothetical protein
VISALKNDLRIARAALASAHPHGDPAELAQLTQLVDDTRAEIHSVYTALALAGATTPAPTPGRGAPTSHYAGYTRITPDPTLVYTSEFKSQLQADVFFDKVDSRIISAGPIGHSHYAPMLKDDEAHPFYQDLRFAKYAPRVFGHDFTFSHLEHDHDELLAEIDRKYPAVCKHLRGLLYDGGHSSWAARDEVIRQYYLAALTPTDLHLVNVVHRSGLALRALMCSQAQVIKHESVRLAAIDAQKIIRGVKYNTTTGAVQYFSRLNTELRYLSEMGMQLDDFSEMQLCGHVLDTFEKAHPAFATKIKWIKVEAEADRYQISYKRIRTDLMKTETKHQLRKQSQTRHANFTGTKTRREETRPPRRPQPWKREYPAPLVAKAVRYAESRLKLNHPGTTRVCANCDPHRRYNGHTTDLCNLTLRRCFNRAVCRDSICPNHPDGAHTREMCRGGANRTARQANAANLRGKPAPTVAAPSPDQLEHLRSFLTLPTQQRNAMLALLQASNE